MRNREKTFYKLTSNVNLREIYYLADTSTESAFYEMGWFDKWGSSLRIYNNNIAFLDKLEGFVSIELLYFELEYQLKNIQYHNTLDWLNHTLFICKDRFRESKKEILNEVVKWCKAKKKVITPELNQSTSTLPLKEKKYLKDLFKDSNVAYDKIIKLLIKHNFIVDNNDNTFDWKGSTEDPSLKPKTSICVLTYLLFNKDYIKINLHNTVIANALTNTFNGITITAKTYGEIKANFDSKKNYSIPFHFIN